MYIHKKEAFRPETPGRSPANDIIERRQAEQGGVRDTEARTTPCDYGAFYQFQLPGCLRLILTVTLPKLCADGLAASQHKRFRDATISPMFISTMRFTRRTESLN
jgi:hypothetical protein